MKKRIALAALLLALGPAASGLVACQPQTVDTSSRDVNLGVLISGARSVKAGETLQLSASVSGSQNGVNWATSDTSLATIDEDGLLKAKKVGEVVVTAFAEDDPSVFDTVQIKILAAAADTFNIRFVNYDGTLLYSDVVEAGQAATYDGEMPTRPWSDVNSYTFEGWDIPLDQPVTHDTTYTAVYKEERIDFARYSFSMVVSGEYKGSYLVTYKGSEETVTLPETYNYRKVIGVNQQGLMGNTFVRTVDVPDTYVFFGAYAFAGCTNLESINIPDGAFMVGAYCFYKCTALQSIVLPDSVTAINDYAFAACPNLAEVSMGEGVKSIGKYAFYADGKLTFDGLPQDLQTIGESAFDSCASIAGDLVLPAGVTTVESYAFSATRITSITIDAACSSFASNALLAAKSLTTITVQEGNTAYKAVGNVLYSFDGTEVIFIPAAFKGSIKIAEGVTTISGFAGALMQATDVTFPSTLTSIASYAFYMNTIGSFTFPAGFVGSQLSFENSAFAYSQEITSFAIPDGVEAIPDYLFQSCEKLADISIPDSVNIIGVSAFDGTAIKSLKLPSSMTEVPQSLLEGTGVTEFTIPASVRSIGDSAFEDCANLKKVTFEASQNIKSVEGRVFYGTSSLTDLVGDFPLITETNDQNLVEFPYGTFAYTALASFKVPEGYQSLGNYSFMYASKLKAIYLPKTLRRIDKWALMGTGLEEIYFGGTQAEFEKILGTKITEDTDTDPDDPYNPAPYGIYFEPDTDVPDAEKSFSIVKRIYDEGKVHYNAVYADVLK